MPKISPMRNPDEKWCSRCKQFLLRVEFHKGSKRKDGLNDWCISCVKTYEESYKLVRAKRKKELVVSGDYNSWWSDKARRNGLELDPRELKAYYKESPFCYYCGIGLSGNEIHLDHKIPKSKGGTGILRINIVITCADCNRLKHTRTDTEFLEFIKGYCQRFAETQSED